jgi:hypothetical protein
MKIAKMKLSVPTMPAMHVRKSKRQVFARIVKMIGAIMPIRTAGRIKIQPSLMMS